MKSRFLLLRISLALPSALLVAFALVHQKTLRSLHQERIANRQLNQSLSQSNSEMAVLRYRERQNQKTIDDLQATARREHKNREIVAGWGLKTISESSTAVIPAIAQIAGVRVGFDTVERLESLYGPGYAYTGGHPHGARQWRSRQPEWYVDADGFYYNKRGGRVLDSIEISTIGMDTAPTVSAPRQRFLFSGCVTLGMTREQVRLALEDKLPPPRLDGDSWVWAAKGFSPLSPNHNGHNVHDWEAALTFDAGRLVKIRVTAD